MKTLFLLAKYYAHEDKSSEISDKHFIKALENTNINDELAREFIFKFLDIDNIEQHPLITDYSIEAVRLEKINFNTKIKQLKELLDDMGFTFSQTISEVLIKKESKINQFTKISQLKKQLNKKVLSQEMAIESVCDKLSESIYIKNEKSPKAILFFLGPPATGKTYLPEVLSENLDEYSLNIFDMTNYTDSIQGFALFGLSEGYKNATEGKLTKFVKENPKSIIVLDEVEKAHPSILQSFLYVLSQGEARDEFTQEMINFRETIFIFTSNLGSELYSNKTFLDKLNNDNDNEDAQSMLLDVISRETRIDNGYTVKALSPEFLSRVSQGDLVLFKKLPFDSYLTIISQTLKENIKSFSEVLEIEVEIKSEELIYATILLGFLPDFDIRRIKSKASHIIFDKITDIIRDEDITDIDKISISIDQDTKNIVENILNKTIQEKHDFIQNYFRKSLSYKYSIDIAKENKTLSLKLTNMQQKRVEKSKDFQGDGAIILEVPDVSFDDISGHKKAKENLFEIIELLNNPQQLIKHNIDMPKGMLLYGVPGTGKTMLAKAFAAEADLPFISTTGAEILDIGFMKKIFKRAREYAPSIIFIDEIDAIGHRDGSNKDIIINQFLTELNGFGDGDDNIFVIGATNIKQKIDPAILRSGRIDQHIEIGNLDKEARSYFIDKIIKNNNIQDINKEKLITYTTGMSGADLEKVNRESSLYKIKHNLDEITQDILLEQINIIKYGERLSGESLELLTSATAYHEAGHAVLSYHLSPEVKIEQITVVPRDDALGFVSYNNEDNFSNLTKQKIQNKICVLLAGRIAQMKQYSNEGFDSGASSDLSHATHLANMAISKLGMGESIGYVSLENLKDYEVNSFRDEINTEIKSWIEDAKKRTQILVDELWTKIDEVAQTLIEKESIEEKELYKIMIKTI
jgi:ATP-dependent Zn protease